MFPLGINIFDASRMNPPLDDVGICFVDFMIIENFDRSLWALITSSIIYANVVIILGYSDIQLKIGFMKSNYNPVNYLFTDNPFLMNYFPKRLTFYFGYLH